MSIDEIFRLILLICGVLIFVMSLLLSFHPNRLFPNRVLSALIFAWGYTVVIFAIQSKELFIRFPHIFGVGTSLLFLFFPLMYMYIKTYLYKEERRFTNLIIHLVPFLILVTALSSFYFQKGETKAKMIADGLPEWILEVFHYADIGMIFLGVLYTILSFRIIYKFEHSSISKLTKEQSKIINWFKKFLMANAVLWAIGASGVFIDMLEVNIPFDLFRVYYLGLTILTLWVSIFTLNRPDLFESNKKGIKKIVKPLKSSWPFPGVKNDDSVGDVKIEFGLHNDKNDVKAIIDYLESDKKPFLNSEMTLQNLADDIGMPKHKVSELLNTEIQLSFYDIINEYRVKEVIKLIQEQKHKEHTLIHLAELAGFNSKATFNRIFKKKSGKTPSQYIQDLNS